MLRKVSRSLPYPLAAVVIATWLVTSAVAIGPPTNYTINQNFSQIDLTASGDIFGGAVSLEEQFPSSPTTYTGTIVAEFPLGPWPGGSISFPGGSAAAANNLKGGVLNTDRQVAPGSGGTGGADPANYGLTFSAPVDLLLPDIPLPPELGGITLSLGTLTSVDLNLALRDVIWDINSNLVDGERPIDVNHQFDASGTPLAGVGLTLVSGFADVNAALVLTQDSFINAGILELALGTLAGQVPELGLSISRPGFFSPDVLVGFGTRLDLTPGLWLPNGATDLATVTYDPLTGSSTLTLPVELAVPDLGIPGILDLDLGFSGQLVATGVVTVPEPSTLIPLAVIATGCFSVRRGRQLSA